MTQTKTRHTCCPPGRGPGFVRTPGCPRCEELSAGSAPRGARFSFRETAKQADARRCAEIAEHFDGAKHRGGGCGPVCTFGEW